MKYCSTGKVQFHFFTSFLLILTKKAFGYSWGNLYIPCLILIITLLFTCVEKKICSSIKIYQNIMDIVGAKQYGRCWIFIAKQPEILIYISLTVHASKDLICLIFYWHFIFNKYWISFFVTRILNDLFFNYWTLKYVVSQSCFNKIKLNKIARSVAI